MSLRAWMDPHDLGHGDEAIGACTCDERHCERHERHRCECCPKMVHESQIAECWPGQWHCLDCLAANWEADDWADSDANRAELDRVGFVVPAKKEAA